MERLVLDPGAPWEAAAARASAVLREGGVALLPAEGVYGLHVRADDPAAVSRLLLLKPRSAEKRFIGLIADLDEIGRWAEASPRAVSLAREHWPGALTLVLPAGPEAPEAMRSTEGTVALRCPGNPFLREVVRGVPGIVLSTSANAPGADPSLRPDEELAARVDLVVDQGSLSGTPSTVVAVEGESVRLLRVGAVRVRT
jgi:L-threonylcarbamoyladenylate synthase